MLKSILNLEGAEQLSSTEQKTIKGGITKQCADAIAAGCVVNVTAADCFAAEGVYNTTCRCCNY